LGKVGLLHLFAGQAVRLFHPVRELRSVNGLILVDIHIADPGLLGGPGRWRLKFRAVEKDTFTYLVM
jgi:hypothetical protein